MLSLAVVLITHDQAWNAARLIRSVLAETAHLPGTDVVLVDADSTDGTTSVAAAHPIDVLALRSAGQHLTPAAGRFVGTRWTTQDLLLYLDGDMELCPGWVDHALEYMSRNDDVATLSGAVIDLSPSARKDEAPPPPPVRAPVDVPYTAGAALHRRRVLDAVGGFNPHLHSDEEPELCIRIRHAGHRVVDLGRPLAHHYTAPGTSLRTLVGRWRRRLFLGAGQCIRLHVGDDLLWPYVRQRGYGLAPGIVLVLGALAARARRRSWLPLWLAVVVGLLALDARRKGSVQAMLFSVLQRLFILDGTLRGFMMRPGDPATPPGRVEVISRRSRPLPPQPAPVVRG